jgi:hypothetical protein
MSFFTNLFGGGYQDAATAQIQGLQSGQKAETPYYNQATGTTAQYGAAALAPYTNLFGTGTTGLGAYGNAVGLGGPGATVDWLQNQPGYQFALGQGLQAIDRGAASRGMLTSGNTLDAEQKYGTGLANQYYQNYVSNLAPYFDLATTGAGGIANTNLATGGNLAGLQANQGTLIYNTNAGIGNAQAAADIASQNAQNSFINNLIQTGGKIAGAFAARPS